MIHGKCVNIINIKAIDSVCVALFRQEIEMKQCSAYGQVRNVRDLLDIPQAKDEFAHYTLIDALHKK